MDRIPACLYYVPYARLCHQTLTPVPSRPRKRNCDTFSRWNRKAFVRLCVWRGRSLMHRHSHKLFRSARVRRLRHTAERWPTQIRAATRWVTHSHRGCQSVRRVSYEAGGCVWTRREDSIAVRSDKRGRSEDRSSSLWQRHHSHPPERPRRQIWAIASEQCLPCSNKWSHSRKSTDFLHIKRKVLIDSQRYFYVVKHTNLKFLICLLLYNVWPQQEKAPGD